MAFFVLFAILQFLACDNSQVMEDEFDMFELATSTSKSSQEESLLATKEISCFGPQGSQSICETDGGFSTDSGLKTWCWGDIEVTEKSDSDSNSFSSGQLRTNSHCNTGMITKVGERLNFRVNPTNPAPQSWCSSSYNYRAEIRENPSDPDHPIGTEQWFGWDYQFGDDYKPDRTGHWLMWQIHAGAGAPASPQMSLWIASQNLSSYSNDAGEIFVVNAARDYNNHQYTPTGITPYAGTKLKIVVHVIFGDEKDGLLQVWINDNMVYNQNIRTVYVEKPVGGYAKWGIYKWKWKDKSFVDSSHSQGIQELNTSMGPLRVLTRFPGDQGYKTNAYNLVVPK